MRRPVSRRTNRDTAIDCAAFYPRAREVTTPLLGRCVRGAGEGKGRIFMLLARNGIMRPTITDDLTDYDALPTHSTRLAAFFTSISGNKAAPRGMMKPFADVEICDRTDSIEGAGFKRIFNASGSGRSVTI